MPLNDYFNFTTPLNAHTLGRESAINDLFTAVAAGFSLIPSTSAFTNNLNGYYPDTSVAVNTILLTPNPILAGYTEGAMIRWKQKIANTGACTLNISALGPINLKRNDGSALISGDLPIDSMPVAILGAAGAIAYLVSASAVDVTSAAGSAAAAAASASAASTSASSAAASLAACNALFATSATPQFAKLGLGMAPTNILDITQNQPATSNASIVNSNGGGAASCRFLVSNGTSSGGLEQLGTAYTPADIHRANGTLLNASGVGGLTLNASNAAGFISFAIASVEAMRIGTAGGLSTSSGTTASTATGTPVTFFTAGGTQPATYLAWINVSGGGIGTYFSWWVIGYDPNGSLVATISGANATLSTITISGLNLRATQNSGLSAPISYSVMKLSA